MAEFVFVPDESAEIALRAAGLSVLASRIEGELPKVGDHVSFPQAPLLAFRIVDRWLRIGEETRESRWYLFITQAPNPLDPPSPH